MKLTPDQQKEIISDESIKECFLKRDDIKPLSAAEQELAWTDHLGKVNQLRNWLSKFDSIVCLPTPTAKEGE